jgi:hypothetical protein
MLNSFSLYSDHELFEEATTALQEAVNKAWDEAKEMLTATGDNDDAAARILGKMFTKHIAPVMIKYDSVGAYDTEPRNIVKDILNKRAWKYVGVSKFLDF